MDGGREGRGGRDPLRPGMIPKERGEGVQAGEKTIRGVGVGGLSPV